LTASTSASASLTRADTSASLAAGSSQPIWGLPGAVSSCPVHTAWTWAAAPGTSRATRRTAETSWVMVSWAAAASARTVESTARRRRPRTIPVSSTTRLTASLLRCGRAERASRCRQQVSVEG